MLKKILFVSLAILFAFTGFKAYVAINTYAENIAAEAEKVKEVIKQAFITHETAYAETVEYGGQAFQGKSPEDAFTELEIYVNNKKGYLDHLKKFIFVGDGDARPYFLRDSNERTYYRHPLKKKNFKDFDFKWVAVNGDSASVRVDIYFEITSISGIEYTMLGGDRHFISLERINSRWQIVWDDWTFLPEYRP